MSSNLAGHDGRERLHHGVRKLVARAEARDRRPGEDRIRDRALERHVDRTVRHLRRDTRQVDDELAAPHRDRHREWQVPPRRVRVVEVAVDVRGGAIHAVRPLLDRVARQALRVVEQLLLRRVHGVDPVAPDQLQMALGADARRGDLRLDVPHNQDCALLEGR